MAKSKENCKGCYNDFYNGRDNFTGNECWHYKDAKFVKRLRIGIMVPPPYLNYKPINVLNCRHEDGFMLIVTDRIDKEGYWT